MRFIGRMLWLVLGLIWRLVVLLLFEKWIPFPEQSKDAAPGAAPRARAKKKRQAQQTPRPERVQTPPSPFELERAQRAEQRRLDSAGRASARGQVKAPAPFFAAQSSELSPELAAQREGEHWLGARAQARAPAARARHGRERLASLLRDKRALRDAVLLGAALAPRRMKP